MHTHHTMNAFKTTTRKVIILGGALSDYGTQIIVNDFF